MKKNKVLNLLLLLCAVVFVGSGVGIGYKLIIRDKAENQIEELKTVFNELPGDKNSAVLENEVNEADEEEASDGLTFEEELAAQLAFREERLPGYAKLKVQNEDMKGWITIPGTKVDYPVMQSTDRPDYYLKHNFDGEKSSYGTPYIAESCDLGGGVDNIVIYGHHMKDGTMFGGLMKYMEESYYKAHPFVWFDTPEGIGLYQIVGVTKASAAALGDERLFELAADGTKRQEFLDEVSGRLFYDTGQMDEAGDLSRPLLVMITCEYSQSEGRLLLVAREVHNTEE